MSTFSRRQLVTLDLDARRGSTHWMRVHRPAMACRFEVVMSADRARDVPAARRALDEADRIEAALTVFRDSSELMRINRLAAAAPVAVDDEVLELLQTCRRL